jgi:hypothetical protein
MRAEGSPVTDREVVKVDVGYRRNLFIGYAALVAAVFAAVRYGYPQFQRLLAPMPFHQSVLVTEAALIALLLCFIGPAVYLMSVGRRILKHDCTPYPGMKVIHDTVVLRGRAAQRRGRALLYLGIAAVAMAALGAVGTHVTFYRMRHDPMLKWFLMPPERPAPAPAQPLPGQVMDRDAGVGAAERAESNAGIIPRKIRVL